MKSEPTIQSVAQRIRTLRKQRGWTLSDVETLSRGSIRAVVLGSYERGDRAMSLSRVIELADLFDIPLTHLLCEPEKASSLQLQQTLMIDLRRTKSLTQNSFDRDDQTQLAFAALIAWIATRRSDWNGEVMSLRTGDLSTLSLMASLTEEQVLEWLEKNNLLFTGPGRP